MGLWVGESEGAHYWLLIINELKNWGVEEILIACIDSLIIFPEAISSVFPKTETQLCIVHMIRNALPSTFIKYPEHIRKIIYTTNALEGLHRQLRKMTKKPVGLSQ